MKKYQYQIIRYVHDHFTGEFVNVGVVVYSKDHRFLACKTTKKFQRITNMFPEASGRWIIRLLNHFESRLNTIAKELHELFGQSEYLDQITGSIINKDNTALQFSLPHVAIDMNLDTALHDLYSSQVEKYVFHKEDSGTLNDEDVWKQNYKIYFEKYGLNNRLKSLEVKVPKDVFVFDKSWKNEIWHSYEPVSFALKEKDSVKDKVYKWAGRLQGLQHADQTLHLTLMTSISPVHKGLMPFIKEYLQVNSEKLTVEIITEDKAENLAREIQQKMDVHDQ